MCPADMGDGLKPSQSFAGARVSYFTCILYEKHEAAEVREDKNIQIVLLWISVLIS